MFSHCYLVNISAWTILLCLILFAECVKWSKEDEVSKADTPVSPLKMPVAGTSAKRLDKTRIHTRSKPEEEMKSKILHDKYIVCYIGTWSVYRPGRGSFKIEDISPKLCTHIVYAFVGLNATTNTLRSIDPYYDLEENYGKGSFKKMTQLKSKNPDLKVTLAVGGWNEGSQNYSRMAMDSDSRRTFIASVIAYVTKYNFDGFDLDWEFPTQRGGKKEDRDNFVLLVKELKKELEKYNLILTAALGAAPDVMDNAYNVEEISKYLDLIHLMCYDYNGPWSKTVAPNAPINSKDNLNVKYSVEYILKLGAPPEKVVLGIPVYGHTFLVDSTSNTGLGTLIAGPGKEGVFTKQEGFQGYNEICMEIASNKNWSIFWDEYSSTPFATKDDQVISYDDERSVTEKVKLGMKYRLGGFMMWSIDTDDFHGDCEKVRQSSESSESNSKSYAFPLLRAVHRAIEDYSFDNNDVEEIETNDINERDKNKSRGNLIQSQPFLITFLIFIPYYFVTSLKNSTGLFRCF